MAFNTLSLEQKLLTKAVSKGDCLIWAGQKTKTGYGILRFNGRQQKAHRLMYQLRNGPIQDKQVVRHICDNPSCINPSHLCLGTQLDNVKDMFSRGRANKTHGENHPKSKLTLEQVTEIRRRYVFGAYGKGAGSLAREFCVSKPVVLAIINQKTWKQD